ncbi:MAG: GntR family transcriptional regulator [Bryobacterales bacterium]|nr:GntR family transcriptional regulator [Bryobacterales bacterium]
MQREQVREKEYGKLAESEYDSSLLPPRAEALSVQVAESIREALYAGELEPGQYLRELVLARAFQVSQATIREALAQLEHNGLVIRAPNRGTTVAVITRADALERIRVWCHLEQLALVEGVKHVSDEEIARIEALASQVTGRKARSFSHCVDRELHCRFWRLAGNSALVRTLDQLTMPLFVFRRYRPPQNGHYERVIDALRERDTSALPRAVEALHSIDGSKSHSAKAATRES